MNGTRRLIVVSLCLAVGILGEVALERHLSSATASPYPELKESLGSIPLRLEGEGTGWKGIENSQIDALRKKLTYQVDDLLYRLYQSEAGGPVISLYMVHSRIGDDRKHHPEICIRDVTGAPEDLATRKIIPLDPEGRRQVQRFRFQTGTDRYTTVYYWHYTFGPLRSEGQSFVQMLHQRLGQPAPSITVQVSSEAPLEQLEGVEKSFLPALDATLQEACLPATAWIGCNRLPIGLVRE